MIDLTDPRAVADALRRGLLAGETYDHLADAVRDKAVRLLSAHMARMTGAEMAEYARAADEAAERYAASLTPAQVDQVAASAARTGEPLRLPGVEQRRDPETGLWSMDTRVLSAPHRRTCARVAARYHAHRPLGRGGSVPAARTQPRQRGAGRPALRGAGQRSCARSGDSGDDDPHPSEPRRCPCGCGASLAGRRPQTVYAAPACRERHRRRGDRAVDLDLAADRPITLALAGGPRDLTPAEALALLHRAASARYCATHSAVHTGSCPACAQLAEAEYMAYSSSVIHHRRVGLRHVWRGLDAAGPRPEPPLIWHMILPSQRDESVALEWEARAQEIGAEAAQREREEGPCSLWSDAALSCAEVVA